MKTKRVIYVEDNVYVRHAIAGLIEAPGRLIIECTTVAQARAAQAQSPADLLITDVNLPDGSGIELAREILPQQPPCPVIICSGHDLAALRKEIGPRLHLVRKPFDPDEFEALVARLLGDAAGAPRTPD